MKARVEGRQFGFSLLHSEKISQPNAAVRIISRGIASGGLGLRWSPSNDFSVEREQISERSLYLMRTRTGEDMGLTREAPSSIYSNDQQTAFANIEKRNKLSVINEGRKQRRLSTLAQFARALPIRIISAKRGIWECPLARIDAENVEQFGRLAGHERLQHDARDAQSFGAQENDDWNSRIDWSVFVFREEIPGRCGVDVLVGLRTALSASESSRMDDEFTSVTMRMIE